MNVLTFDIEEWYMEKAYHGDDASRYRVYDSYLDSILELLEERSLKATFFCVGGLAREFPQVVRKIAGKGHEIGCHSDVHRFLYSMDRNAFKSDTETAVSSLEDVVGRKVVSYRAPAFSIGPSCRWAFEVLAECGIERDASIYPAVRDFGGFEGFPADRPCLVNTAGVTLKEFPVALASVAGRRMAYSGGGYFRLFPLWYVRNEMRRSDYAMSYFHIADLEHKPMKMVSREQYESYFHQSGTLRNRFVRMVKSSLGTGVAFGKMCSLLGSQDFVSLEQADGEIDWNSAPVVRL